MKRFKQRGHIFLLIGLCSFIALPLASAEVIKLRARADIWLSAFNERERNSSSGKVELFKLKSIQEMAAVRFDPRPIMDREIVSARLFLHTTQPVSFAISESPRSIRTGWKGIAGGPMVRGPLLPRRI